MKLTGARAIRFLEKPSADIIGILLFGPDRGLIKARSQALTQIFMPNADDAFGMTVLTLCRQRQRYCGASQNLPLRVGYNN